VLAAQAGSIEPGAEAEIVVLVRNTGEVDDVFHVVVQGQASPWAVVDPPNLTLAPGEEAPVWVHFRPPRSSDTTPGGVPFAVAVASTGDPEFVAVETGELQVGTFSSLDASLTGEPVSGTRWTELQLSMRNTGNRRVTASVDVDAATAGVLVEVEPHELLLDPGQPAVAAIRVRPPRRVLPHRKDDRGLTVSVVSDGGALVTLRTEYPADASLVNELIRSARVLLVLLVLLFIGGIALLRSESTSGTVSVTKEGGNRAELPTTIPAPSTTAGPAAAEDDEAEAGAAGPEATPVTPVPTTAAKVPATAPPLPKLVFVRVYGPNVRDVVVRAPGSASRELRLRSDGALESHPRLSPDGQSVAFLRERDGAWSVCVISADGGEAVSVSDTTAGSAVAWSPDGQTLWFSRGGRLVSRSFDPATSTVGEVVEHDVAVPGGDFALSPDGTRIVVSDGRRLFVRPVDGTPGTAIETPHSPQDPVFSPDGTRIAYTAEYQIFTVSAGGGTVRQLTSPGTVNGDAAWTGEGDWIVFRSNRTGAGDLYAVQASASGGDEKGLAMITASADRDVSPSF
jgi:sugar lactone lactonase YvrE